jgi:hypothetical protein
MFLIMIIFHAIKKKKNVTESMSEIVLGRCLFSI